MKRHPYGTWSDLEFTLAEARRVMEEHHCEILPSKDRLKELGYSSLANAIKGHHGGFPIFRKLLGEELKQRERGTLKNLEYVVAEARELMEKHDFRTLPCGEKLVELGHSSLSFAISRYHGGFSRFRRVLGDELRRRERGTLKNAEYVMAEARKVMNEHQYKTLPPTNKLVALGYSSLASAIRKYHGGFPNFRRLLGEMLQQREWGSLKNLEYVVAEAQAMMDKHGFKILPSGNKLWELGYSSLSSAISTYHGGFPHFRRLLGEELQQRERGSWKKVEYALAEAREMMKKHGFKLLPSNHTLRDLGYSSLANAITKYHQGSTAFRLKLGEYDQALAVVRRMVEETL